MQSVVTGQAPITLEWKITSGEKQINAEDNTHNNWNKSYTPDKNKRWDERTYVSDTYHTLNESQQKPKPRRPSIIPLEKGRMKKTTSKSKSKKAKDEKNKKSKKVRKKRAPKNTQTCRLASSAGGGVAPRQKNRIRRQGEQGSEKKNEGDTTNKRNTKRNGRGEQ